MNMKKIKSEYNSMEEKYKNNPIYPIDDKLLKKCVIVELINGKRLVIRVPEEIPEEMR